MTVYAGFENERKQFPPPPTTSACPPPPPSPRAAQPPDLTYPSASQSEDSGGILKTPRRIPTSLFFFHFPHPISQLHATTTIRPPTEDLAVLSAHDGLSIWIL